MTKQHMPPQILAMLKKVIAQQEEEQRESRSLEEGVRDLITDLGVALTPAGMNVLFSMSAAITEDLHRDCVNGECEGFDPLDIINVADKFMILWARQRCTSGTEQPEWDERLGRFFAPAPADIKVAGND